VEMRLHIVANAVAGNGGFGLAYDGGPSAEIRGNGAWRNRDGAFSGVPSTADNFEADPGFCDAIAGDFHLQTGSPYGPDGRFGLVGAFGVACDASRILVSWASRNRDHHGHESSVETSPAVAGLSEGEAIDDGGRDVAAASDVSSMEQQHNEARTLVALLGNAVFDASRVLISSARVGGARVEERRGSHGLGDINGDGWVDLVVRVAPGRIGPRGVPVVVEALTSDGTRVRGDLPVGARGEDVRSASSVGPNTTLEFAVSPIWPAPSASRATLRFTSPERGSVRIEVYDVAGRRVSVTPMIELAAGEHRVELALPPGSAPGVYRASVVAGERRKTVPWVVTQ